MKINARHPSRSDMVHMTGNIKKEFLRLVCITMYNLVYILANNDIIHVHVRRALCNHLQALYRAGEARWGTDESK